MRVILVFLLLAFLMVQPVTAVASPGMVVFSEDFSAGLDRWQVARGNPGMWRVTEGVLQGEVLSNSTVTELVLRPDFWSDEWQHYELEWDMKAVAGSDRNIAWGYRNSNNWYEVHFLPSFFEFARVKNQTVVWQKNGTAQFGLGTWQHMKLRVVGESMQLFINGAQVFDGTDPSYEGNAGSIALKVGTGVSAPARVQFDNITVRLLPDPRDITLSVPWFRQDDRVWGAVEYDSAQIWAGTQPVTIERWGCALTSAVMILRYHGFTQLLDGTPLTPLSLNAWLLSQSDGYVAEGWVNWIALVRLTRLLRIEWSTAEKPLPQLRYMYQNWESWENHGRAAIAAEIRAGKPAILELPNHFVVANGLSVDEQVIGILDPASDRTNLSQGFAQPTSARLWQVETGDEVVNLSYWLLVFPRGYRIKILTADGVTITNWWLSQDLPGSLSEDFSPSRWLALTVPQPPDGEDFKLEIAPATGQVGLDGGEFPVVENLAPYQAYELQLYRYNAEANVTQFALKGAMGTLPQLWEFSGTTVQQKLDWQSLERELTLLEQRGLLFPVVAARLKQIVQLAQMSSDLEHSAVERQQINRRYLTWFKNLFEQVQVFDARLVSAEARSYLEILLDQQLIPSGD